MVASLVPQAVRDLASSDERGLAVFDADGVLWHGDVSEDFTLWMIGEGHFDGRLWPVYERCNAEDPAAGALQILAFYRGMAQKDLRLHVEHFWQSTAARPWLMQVRATVRWAEEHGFTVFVVSATPSPVLQPLKRHLPVADVLALDLEFDVLGHATGNPAGVTTVGSGKAERVRAASRAPVQIAVGNSILDIPMLRMSTGVAWAINPDSALREAAEREGWLITHETQE